MTFPISREEGLEILLKGSDGPITTVVNAPDIDRLQRLLGRMLEGCDPRTCYDIARAFRESRLSEGVLDMDDALEDDEEPDDLEGEIEGFLNGWPLLRERSQALSAAAQHVLATMDWHGVLKSMEPERVAQLILVLSGDIHFDHEFDVQTVTLVIHGLALKSRGRAREEALVKALLICQATTPEFQLL